MNVITFSCLQNSPGGNGAAGSIAEEVLSSIRTVVAFDGKKKKLHFGTLTKLLL
jgi:hypothetical protein